jgi:predicted SnoaL-like aldol condensation-catalyzing enzyme
MSSEQDNKVVVRRFFEEVFDGGDLDVADEVFDAEHRILNPYASEGMRGPESMKGLALFYRNILPDPEFVVEDEVAEGDKVMTRWTLRGTLMDDLRALGIYGKVAISGISISRVVDDKIQETWLRCETYLEQPQRSVSQDEILEWLRRHMPTSEEEESDLEAQLLELGLPPDVISKFCCMVGFKFCCKEPEPSPGLRSTE